MKTPSTPSSFVFIQRFLLLAFCTLPALRSSAVVIPTYEWTGNLGTTDYNFNWEEPGNWLNHVAPSAQSQPGDIVFPSTPIPVAYLNSALPVNSLTFATSTYPFSLYSTTYSQQNPAALYLGGGGITVGDTGNNSVYLYGINLGLQVSQTWNTAGNLTIYGPILSGNTTRTVTKTGNGYLSLNSSSTFAGGLTVSAGTLYLSGSSLDTEGYATTDPQTAVSGSAGIGQLTLQDNTTLGANDSGGFTLANNVSLGTGVRFGAPLYVDSNQKFGGITLTLGGTVTAANPSTSVQIDPLNRVDFSGTLTGPAGATVTFTGGGTAILSGATSAQVSRLEADHAALFLATPASLPVTSLQVFNGGYLGLGAGFDGSAGHASVADAIRFITDPQNFNGTLGLDTETDATMPNTFHGAIDLTGFTNAGFTGLGTGTYAQIASDAVITPSGDGNYKFGGGGGRLVVGSNLGESSSAGLTVSSPADQPTTIVLQGENTFTGPVQVSNSLLILDSNSALSGSKRVQLQSGGYLGATGNWFGSASDLFGLLDPASLSASGIVGFDSPAPASSSRYIGSGLDLSSLASAPELPYIGTTTFGYYDGVVGLQIDGPITVPAGQALKLAGLQNGYLAVTSDLTPTTGISSLIIGYNDGLTHLGDQGTVVLSGANTYTGGTTLRAGTLALAQYQQPVLAPGGPSAGALPDSSPIGSGDLTIAADAVNPTLLPYGDVTLANNIILNAAPATPLVVGQYDSGGSFTFDGVISGPGALRLQGTATLNGANTYSGGTTLAYADVTTNDPSALGSGPLILTNSATLFLNTSAAIGSLNPGDSSGEYDSNTSIYLANDTTLTINQTDDGEFGGTITGDTSNNASLVKEGSGMLGFHSANGYTGGTTVNGGIVVTSNDQGLGTGPVTLNSGTAFGIDDNTTLNNNLTLNGATLAGFGTYAPVNGTLVVAAGSAISPGAKIDPNRGSGGPGTINTGGGAPGSPPISSNDSTPPVGPLTFGSVSSPITLTFGSGGTYSFGLQDATGGALHSDFISVNGDVAITASPSAPFNFTLSSFDATGAAGALQNFNNQQSYSWTALTANSITGFDPAAFDLSNLSAFSNSLGGGSFSLSYYADATSGTSSLYLNFNPASVPEPSTYALFALGLGLVLWLRRRTG